MTNAITPTDNQAAPNRNRWTGTLHLIASYLFGLAAIVSANVSSGSKTESLVQAGFYFALSFVFLVLGLRKIRQVRQQHDVTTASPGSRHLWTLALITLLVVAIPISLVLFLPPRWRPQLEIKNTGATAVVFSYNGKAFVSAPGETWHMRFSAGDTLTVRSGAAADAPSRIVPLPADNPKPWTLNPTAQRYTAEVNADDPQNIRVEKRLFEEITAPRSTPEPWPPQINESGS